MLQATTTNLMLGYRLATTILTQKAKRAGVAYNVNAHVAQLAQQGGLPCNNAIQQAIATNSLHNVGFNFNSLQIQFYKLYRAFLTINLNVQFMVKNTPAPNLNYMFE
jgi:hypothetical protein